MGYKRIKFRVDSNNNIAIRENVTRAIKGDTVRVSVTLGLNEALRLANIYILKQNCCVPVSDLLNDNHTLPEYLAYLKYNNTPIYYILDTLMYLCVINLVLSDNILKKRVLSLYCPFGYSSTEPELVCKPITNMFPHPIRDALLINLFDFAIARSL